MKKYNCLISKSIYTIKAGIFVFAIFILNSCQKDNDLNFILQNEWKIKSIVNSNKSLYPPSNTLREEAYILKFISDSSFYLATSVNYAGGICRFVSDKNIIINRYGNFTEVGGETNFDEQLYFTLINVTQYSCSNSKLIFLIDKNNKIIFTKH